MEKSEFKFLNRGFKKNLVLIPGWAFDYRIFSSLDLNYNYLIPAKISLPNFAKDLSERLDKLSFEKISLFGWSLGGFLAQDFALKYPDRTEELFLLSIRRSFPQGIVEEIKTKLKKDKRAYLYKFYLECFSVFDKESLGWFKKNLLKDYLDKMQIRNLLAGLNYLSSAKAEPLSLGKIKRIRIFHGRHDAIAPFLEAKQIKSKIPQAEFIYFKNLGHILFLNPKFKERFNGQGNPD